ncbi:MAG: RagB/SusD family nutrient uptake outer membrane protein [Prevotella sp.]|nr:RagB/SusD family nutrient uptake outer membrane protein [Prevotella sp.]
MKLNIKYIAITAMGTLALTSCSDMLDVSSPSQTDDATVYASEEYTLQALYGAYNLFGQDSYTSRMCGVYMQNTDVEASAPSAGVPSSDRRAVWSLQSSAITGFNDMTNMWNHNLQAIDRANQVIEGINGSSIGSNANMQQMKGEAVCIKAYRYYLMCGFWGDVPYYNTASKWGGNLDKPRADKFSVYSRILQELVDIEPNMKFSDANSGGIERMNRDFAIGMIARLALFRAGYAKTIDGQMKRADDYLDVNADSLSVTYTNLSGQSVTAHTHNEYVQMAKDYCQKLINLKPRNLYDDFYNPFANENAYMTENNAEILYEVAFVESMGGDVGWSIGVTNSGACKNGTTTNQVGLTPSYYLSFADNDQRRDVTCAKWQHQNDIVYPTECTGMGIGKWDRALATKNLGSSSSKGTGINYPLMRYSDVLLMLAEAENELNGPTALAKEALAKVRARAFKNSPTYTDDVNNYVANLTTKEAFFNAIVDERAWEFGGEGLRRFDLIRWNIYAQKIEQAMRTMLCWGISTNEELLALDEVKAAYPEAANYVKYADKMWFKRVGATNTKADIVWYDQKYRPVDDDATMEANGWVSEEVVGTSTYRSRWGTQLIKRVSTYTYNGTEYASCTKSKDATTGVTTYTLGTAPAQVVFTVESNQPSGVTRTDSYQASDYATRIYRGYANGALKGDGNVPFLLPISITNLNSSAVLNNDGYGILSNQTGEGVNAIVAVIQKENY